MGLKGVFRIIYLHQINYFTRINFVGFRRMNLYLE